MDQAKSAVVSVKNTRSIGNSDAEFGSGMRIDVVEADAEISNNFEAGCTFEHFAVDAVGDQSNHAVRVFEVFNQFRFGKDSILKIGGDRDFLFQFSNGLIEYRSGNEDLPEHPAPEK